MCLVFILWGRTQRDRDLDKLETLQRQLQFSRTGPIVPSAAVLDSLRQAIQKLEIRNSILDTQLYTVDPAKFRSFSGDSTSAYFELAGFVEGMTREFGSSSIGLNEGERFGFAQFEQQGPDREILDLVMAQKKAAEVILRILHTSRPVSLHGLKREIIEKGVDDESLLQQAVGTKAARRTRHADTIEGGEKIEGFGSYTFELTFEGYTQSLRQFLIETQSAPVPVLVTGLRVEPLDRFKTEESGNSGNASSNPFDLLADTENSGTELSAVPIIRNNLSLFHLELEVYMGEGPSSDS